MQGRVKYSYDAAGRMISESSDNSNKIYNYAWQDKVVSIDNNGAKVNFEYYPDGQLAQKMTGKDTERFYWDGLALMKRDSSEYTIEPAVTGGNPIIADGKVLFNDLLGNTVGYQDNNQFNPITRNAFGQSGAESKSSLDFFTGKPNIPELGYNFMFRNYRPELGKWQTADPLGYPDGWNNLAYCNNKITANIDFLGMLLISVSGAGEASTQCLANGLKGVGITPDQTFSWTDTRAIARAIESATARGEPVTVIAHSYGASTALDALGIVKQEFDTTGKTIGLVTLDGVGRFSSTDNPGNLSFWSDIYATGGGMLNLNNIIAGTGGSWNGTTGANEEISASVDHADVKGMLNAANNYYKNKYGVSYLRVPSSCI